MKIRRDYLYVPDYVDEDSPIDDVKSHNLTFTEAVNTRDVWKTEIWFGFGF